MKTALLRADGLLLRPPAAANPHRRVPCGRGYAGAAVREICRWGFAELGPGRIEWRAEVGNDASRRVVEKAGFTVEGLLRRALRAHGGRRDCWVGSLLNGAVR